MSETCGDRFFFLGHGGDAPNSGGFALQIAAETTPARLGCKKE
jgi:hypothetical protein